MDQINFRIPFSLFTLQGELILSDGCLNSAGRSLGHLHEHPYYELHFILSGEHILRFSDGEERRFAADSVIFIPPGFSHAVNPASKKDSSVRAAIWFSLQESALSSRKNSVLPYLRQPYFLESSSLCSQWKTLGFEIQHHLCGFDEKCSFLFSSLMIDLLRLLDVPPACFVSPSLQKDMTIQIEEYLLSHLSLGCTQRELAQILSLSERQTNRILQKCYHKNFRELLLDVRMNLGNRLLEENSSIQEISERLGYQSPSAFTHAYTAYFGLSPSKKRLS